MGDGIISRRGLGSGGGSGDYYTRTQTDEKLSLKVDKVAGKQLSDENYTAVEKAKLANISGITNYVTGNWTPSFAYYRPADIYYPMDRWALPATNYSSQEGHYILIGDLCFVTFSIRGTITSHPGDYRMGIGPLPFNSGIFMQPLTLSVCVRYSSSDNTQLWTPTAGIVARIWDNIKYAEILQQNGYIRTYWPSDISNPYYIEGSGVYQIKNSNLSDTPIDTAGSSAPA